MPDPTLPAPSAVPFDLEGLADLARQASPELAKQVNNDLGEPDTPTEIENTVPETEEPVVPEVVEESEPEAKSEEVENDLGPASETTLEDELQKLNQQTEAPKAKTSEKKSETVLNTQKAKAEEPPVNQRDSDLKLDDRASAVLHPKTKKIIEERNQKIVSERNKSETLLKEKAALEAELTKIREDLKKSPVPKDVQDELTKLRQAIREADITRDPELKAKYDAPIATNEEKILTILKEFGLGTTADGKPDPEAIEEIKKGGLNFAGLAPMIKKLSDAGEEGAAEELREILRENRRLEQTKAKEISEWQTNFDAKQAMTQRQRAELQEKTAAEVREHANRALASDLENLAKDFPFINRPADPLPTDSPAISKSKLDAIAAYDAAAKAVGEAVASLDPSKAPPEKVAEVNGRFTATAVQGIILKQHVLPRLMKELSELKTRNSELETKVGKIKTAGNLSRAHAAAASSPAGAKTPLPESNEDAARQIAKEMGLAIE